MPSGGQDGNIINIKAQVTSQLHRECQNQWHSLRKAMDYIVYIKGERWIVKHNQRLSRSAQRSRCPQEQNREFQSAEQISPQTQVLWALELSYWGSHTALSPTRLLEVLSISGPQLSHPWNNANPTVSLLGPVWGLVRERELRTESST